jgi:hypothetical protein
MHASTLPLAPTAPAVGTGENAETFRVVPPVYIGKVA